MKNDFIPNAFEYYLNFVDFTDYGADDGCEEDDECCDDDKKDCKKKSKANKPQGAGAAGKDEKCKNQ